MAVTPCRNYTKSLLGIETNDLIATLQSLIGRNYTKSLLGIETRGTGLNPFWRHIAAITLNPY